MTDIDELVKFAKVKPGKTESAKMTAIRNAALTGLSDDWKELLNTHELTTILTEIAGTSFTPDKSNIFHFARMTALDKVKVVIVGQDPYPRAGDAHGLAFSCLTNIPASLLNVYKCLLAHKLINEMPDTGNLEYWAEQGVLLINRSLTTLVGKSNAHAHLWHDYTTALITRLSEMKPLIFMLWGNNARELTEHLDSKSTVFEWAHPSPLAQSREKFVNCTHFKDVNKLLIRLGKEPIDWNTSVQLTEIEKEFDAGPKTQVVFTDGSCYPNKSCPEAKAGYAAAFALGSLKDTVLYGNIKNRPEYATNQRAEGYAIIRVFEHLIEHNDEWEKCIVVSDSDFWIKMCEVYMPKWAQNDSFDEKKNPDMTKKMWGLYTTIMDSMKTVQFRHMKSHGKDGWQHCNEGSYKYFCYINNKYVDELAGYARQELQPGEDVVTEASYEE